MGISQYSVPHFNTKNEIPCRPVSPNLYGIFTGFTFSAMISWNSTCLGCVTGEEVPKIKKILISGYYGFGNIGDEAILASTVAAFRSKDPNVQITALSESPETTRDSYNITALPRMSLTTVVRAISASHMVLFGGGSLLQDSTSFRSLMYYLSILFLSRLQKKPTVVYANGIGPVTSWVGRRLTRLALSKVAEITVRDRESLNALRDMGVCRPVTVTADPAFLLNAAPDATVDQVLKTAGCDGKLVWFALRPNKAPKNFYLDLAKSAAGLRLKGFEPCLMVMQDRDMELVDIFNRFLCQMGEKPAPYVSDLSPAEALGVLRRGQFCVGMRLHTLILSAQAGVPFLGIDIDPKIGAFCRMTKCPVLPNPAVTPENPESAVYDLADHAEALGNRLESMLPSLRSRAAQSVDIALSVLNSAY